MKDFTKFSQELMESFYHATNAIGGVPCDGITDKNGIVDNHQTWKPKELRRINAYINSLIRGQTMEPDAAVTDLRMRLAVIGLDFEKFSIDDEEGRVIVPVSQYKGFGWDAKEGEVENFDNIRPENELYLVFDWWSNEDYMVQMAAKIVTENEVDEYMDESMEEGLDEETDLEEGCKKGLKEEDGVCPECGKEECECGESEDGEDDDEEELEESRTFSAAEEMGYRERYERPKPPSWATTTAKGIFLHYGVANRLKSDETYKDWFKAFKELPIYEKDALISAMYSAKDEMKDWDKVEDFVNSYPRLKKAVADRNETEFDKRKKRLGEAAKIPKGWDAYEYKIGSHYLPTLINGDSTGLSDEEERDFDKWLDGLDMPKGGHWDYDEDERDEFGKDAVSGLRGDVTLVRYLFKTDKKKVNEECELNESGWKGKRKTPYQPYDKNKAADNKSTKELQAELKKFEEHWAEIKEDPKYEKAAGKFYTDHIAFLKMKIAERIGKKNVNEEAVLDITGGDNNPERLANLKLIAGEVEEGLANLFPYYKVEVRENLGDSVYIVVSTQKKEQWANGIMENSPLIKAFVHSSTRRYDPQKSKLEFDPFMQPRAAKMRKRTETDASKLADYIIAQFKKAALNLKSVNEETDTEELKYLKPRTHKTNT